MKVAHSVEKALQGSAGSVTLTYAQSVDGCICRERGQAVAISSAESFHFTHHLRAHHAAIVVGVGTLVADDPSLTTRLVQGADPQPVVLDSRLRTPLNAKVLKDERCKIPPMILCTRSGREENKEKAEQLESLGAKVVTVEGDGEHLRMENVLAFLKGEFESVMIEGGAAVITSILSSQECCKMVDRVVLTIAPLFLGGLNAVQSPIPDNSSRFWKVKESEPLGGDIIVHLVPVSSTIEEC